MIILSAEESSEKGKAFEEFISILLSRLGYQVTNRRVRKAGRELDILAVSKVTGAPVLIECKAEESLIASKDYNKFYGVFEHEARKPVAGLTGLMISLSGFNSEVIANYEEKSEEDRRRFKIYGPDFVKERAVEARLIADDRTVQHQAKKSWPFDLGETILAITKQQLYRIQLLQKDGATTHFIAYRAHCEDPTDYEINLLHKTVTVLNGLESFNLSARKEVLLALSRAEGFINVEDLREITKQSLATIRSELAYLESRNLIGSNGGDKISLVQDVRAFSEISLELLNPTYKYPFLLSRYFDEMNDHRLAEYCLSRRFLKPASEMELNILCAIFRFSPSALYEALFGDITADKIAHDHAKKLGNESESLAELFKSSFFTKLIPHLLSDLHNGNKVIDSLPSVVGWLEEYHLALANTWDVFFDFKTAGISTRMIAGEDMEAGSLVTIREPQTKFNAEMTTFNLTKGTDRIDKMIQVYQELKASRPDSEDLPAMANNIGVCFMAISDNVKAAEWFNKGLEYGRDIPELRSNLAKVSAD
jgi:tetratricopeptide (TPR) repeat protein